MGIAKKLLLIIPKNVKLEVSKCKDGTIDFVFNVFTDRELFFDIYAHLGTIFEPEGNYRNPVTTWHLQNLKDNEGLITIKMFPAETMRSFQYWVYKEHPMDFYLHGDIELYILDGD